MVRVDERSVVLQYAGETTALVTVVVATLFAIACVISLASVQSMFLGAPSQRALRACNWAASCLFLHSLATIVSCRREPTSSLTSHLLLYVTMGYLFAFFGVRAILEDAGGAGPLARSRRGAAAAPPPWRGAMVERLPEPLAARVGEFLAYCDVVRLGRASRLLRSRAELCLRLRESFALPDLSCHGGSLRGEELYRQRRQADHFADAELSRVVSSSPALRVIRLRGLHHLSDEGVASALGALRGPLDSLDLSGSLHVGDRAALCVAAAPRLCGKLQLLQLDDCAGVSASALAALAAASGARGGGLQAVSLRRTQARDDCLLALASPHLQVLDVGGCRLIGDAGLRALALGAPNLRALCLDGCPGVTAAGLVSALRGCCPVLTRLSARQLSSVASLGAGLKELPPQLQELDLSGTDVSEAQLLAALPRLAGLRRLALSSCAAVTDCVLQSIAKACPELRGLELLGCGELTGRGLLALARTCAALELLNVGNCAALTCDDVLQVAAAGRALRLLGLSGCARVRRDTVRRLCDAHEQLEVLYEYDRVAGKHASAATRAKSLCWRLLVGQGLGVALIVKATAEL
jgi:hypothetical protein